MRTIRDLTRMTQLGTPTHSVAENLAQKPLTIRPRVTLAEDTLRATRAEVELDALAHNLRVVRKAAGTSKVLAVVKADAYGHGVVPVATRLQAEGVDGFGVALAEEAIELREAGIDAKILILNGGYAGAHADVIARGLTPVLHDLAEAHEFGRAAAGKRFGIHIEIDTGMARLGVQMNRLESFLAELALISNLRIDGVMTHFSSADRDDETTREQLARFAEARETIAAFGHRPQMVHAANSAGLMCHPESRFDMVRPGLALFGVPPAKNVGEELRPAMRLRTQVLAMRDLEAGMAVGYNTTFHATRRTIVATVPIGYGDGLFRSASNRGHMLVRGERAPIIGAISMDLTTLDVTDIAGVDIGDEVIVLGSQNGVYLGADEVADAAGTIAYEVLTNVSRRVPRFYI